MLLIAAATVLVIVLTNSGDDEPTAGGGPATDSSQALTSIRAYPSREFTPDPAAVEAQEQAQQVAAAWVQAMNDADIDTAREHMCRRNSALSDAEITGGIELGTIELGNVAVNGKNGLAEISFTSTGGRDVQGAAPMMLQDDNWTICVA